MCVCIHIYIYIYILYIRYSVHACSYMHARMHACVAPHGILAVLVPMARNSRTPRRSRLSQRSGSRGAVKCEHGHRLFPYV